jgi:hypothetical protein
MISRMVARERESWERFYSNCLSFSDSLWFIWCYSFLCYKVVLFFWAVVLAALDWGTVPVSACGISLVLVEGSEPLERL